MVTNKAIRSAIYTKLNVAAVTTQLTDGSAGIFYAVVPAKTPPAQYPVVIYHRQSDVSTLRMGGNAFDSQIWMVKAVVRDTLPGAAEDIDKAVRDLLDFGTLTIAGGTLMHLARESGVAYADTDGDTIFHNCGSLFRLVVQT